MEPKINQKQQIKYDNNENSEKPDNYKNNFFPVPNPVRNITFLGKKRHHDTSDDKNLNIIHYSIDTNGIVHCQNVGKRIEKKIDPKINIKSENNSSNQVDVPKLNLLNFIVNKYGMDNVLNAMCKSEYDTSNLLELSVMALKYFDDDKSLPFYLIKLLYSYFSNFRLENNKCDK